MREFESTRNWAGSGSENESDIVGLRSRMKMITFIKRDGTRFSASYSHLHGIHLITGGLRLEFTRCGVVVKGERLSTVHHTLADHRVAFLRESSSEVVEESSSPYIRKIILTGPGGMGASRA